MYHGEDQSVPYSTQTKHHKVVAKITVEAVLKHFEKAKYLKDRHCTFILNEQETSDLSLLGRNISEWKFFRRSEISILLNAGNMYRRCLSPQSIDVVTCNYAVHCMENIPPVPCFLPNLVPESDDRDLIRKQAATEWTNFLAARCDELKIDGILVTTMLLDNEPKDVSLMADVWSSMFDCDLITEAEYRGPVVPIYYRTPEEVLAPFRNGVFRSLRLVYTDQIPIDHMYKCLDSAGRIDTKTSARRAVEDSKCWSRKYIHKCLQGTEEYKRRILDTYYERLNAKALLSSCENMSALVMVVVVVKE